MALLTRKQKRHEHLISALRANPSLRIAELAESLAVSTETVRRDLDELGEAGLVNRTYGGASLPPIGQEPGVGERLQILVEERTRIAHTAALLVPPGSVVMIDGGSTTIHLARQLAAQAKRLTVITNSPGVASASARDPETRVLLAAGDYLAAEGIVHGPDTQSFLARFHADLALIGAGGLTVDGPCDVVSGAAWAKRAMLGRAARRVLLLDRSKFDEPRLELVCPLDDLDDLVTDGAPPDNLAQALAANEVAVHIAKNGSKNGS